MTQITDPKEKLSAALAAIFFFAPHFLGKKTEFVTFYMRLGFGNFLFFFGVSIIRMILGGIPFIGMLLTLSLFAVLCIAGFLAYVAYNGEKFEISFLQKIANIVISKIPGFQSFFTPNN